MAVSITLRNIHKKYGDTSALNNVTLGVQRGHIHAIIGTTGSGKSVLLRIIATLAEPDLGSGYINGLNMGARQNQIRHQIGYMAQDSRFEKELTLIENLVLHGRLHGIRQDDLLTRISGFATRFNILHSLNKYPDDVSHGTRRKIEFIRAVLHNPSILLLDEPTASLDKKSKDLMETFLREQKSRFTTVMVSSNLEQVQRMADRISLLCDGRVIAEGTMAELQEVERDNRIYDITLLEKHEQDLNVMDASQDIISYSIHGNRYEIVSPADVPPQHLIELFPDRVIAFIPRLPDLPDLFKRLIQTESSND